MNYSYKSILFIFSVYYVVVALSLPLVYAITYQLSFSTVYTLDWFFFVLMFYPLILFISGSHYCYQRIKNINQHRKKVG